MSLSVVDLDAITESFKKNWKRWLTVIIFLAAAIGFAFWGWYSYQQQAALAPIKPSKIIVTATCTIGSFTDDTQISVEIYDKDYALVTTVFLTSPAFTAVIQNPDVSEYFYVRISDITSSAQYYYLPSAYSTEDPTLGTVEKYDITSDQISVVLNFAKVGNLTFDKSYPVTIDEGTTEVSLVLYFNMTPESMLRNVTLDLSFDYNATIVTTFKYNISAIYVDDMLYEENATLTLINDLKETKQIKIVVVLKLTVDVTQNTQITMYLDVSAEKMNTVRGSATINVNVVS